MIVIVASQLDVAAATLARVWGDACALVTTWELSTPGWLLRVGCRGANTWGPNTWSHGEGGGRSDAITGVLVRLPFVTVGELQHVQPEDREFVAAEQTAFLRAWLDTLSVPVYNRSDSAALIGGLWSPWRWARQAHSLGLPVHESACKGFSLDTHPSSERVTVVGDQVFGPCQLVDRARALSVAARLPLLSMRFTPEEGHFLGAWPSADVTDPTIQAPLLAQLS